MIKDLLHMRSCKSQCSIFQTGVQFTHTVLGDLVADLAKTCFSNPAQTLFEHHSIPIVLLQLVGFNRQKGWGSHYFQMVKNICRVVLSHFKVDHVYNETKSSVYRSHLPLT